MLAAILELVNSDTVVEISDGGVKVYDNVEGHRPLRQVIELEDAVTLAKAILFFAENGCDEATAAAIERMEAAEDARYDAVSAHFAHD